MSDEKAQRCCGSITYEWRRNRHEWLLPRKAGNVRIAILRKHAIVEAYRVDVLWSDGSLQLLTTPSLEAALNLAQAWIEAKEAA